MADITLAPLACRMGRAKRATGVMEIIPAIDLLQGSCVRLHQGDYDQVTRFSDDPLAQAQHWVKQGATRLHLVDLDGARSGEPINDQAVRLIAKELSIPVQLGGGVRSLMRAEELLSCGLDRVILGTVALENPELVRTLARRHPHKIVVGIDARNGLVATRGWVEESDVEATALAQHLSTAGIAAIISTDIATDGTLAGTSLLKDLCTGTCSGAPNFYTKFTPPIVNGIEELYFTANMGVDGAELWITDGTAGNTRRAFQHTRPDIDIDDREIGYDYEKDLGPGTFNIGGDYDFDDNQYDFNLGYKMTFDDGGIATLPTPEGMQRERVPLTDEQKDYLYDYMLDFMFKQKQREQMEQESIIPPFNYEGLEV